MTFTTYDDARSALDAINRRVREAEANRPTRMIEETRDAMDAYREEIGTIYREAKELGFIRLFDGHYRLAPAQADLPNA